MFKLIKKIINEQPDVSEQTDPQIKIHLAAGVLLLEAAHVDNECTEEEMEQVVVILKDKFNLREFHDFLLAQGLLPPEILKKTVEENFIAPRLADNT